MAKVQRINTCLWFDGQAEEAAQFYTGIFPNSRVREIARYPGVGQEIHGHAEGSVMTVAFDLGDMEFTALNGGPEFQFSLAVSFQVMCDTQEEVDYYWERLGAGGDPSAQVCGWLKDKYGVSWQVVPTMMERMFDDYQSEGARRAMAAMLEMKKLDIAALRRAYDGA